MGYVARFEKGQHSIALDGGRYRLFRDFVPPTASIEPQIFTGTSANSHGGGGLVGVRAQNVSLSFGVTVSGSSRAEIQFGVDELNRFLSMAGNELEPLYFAFRNHNIYPFEPLWGQAGACRRLEVVYGLAEYDPGYGSYPPDAHGQLLPNCLVSLTVKPYAFGQRQRLASAKGGVLEEIDRASGRTRGIYVLEATTNKVLNPSFEASGNYTALGATVNRVLTVSRYGDWSLQVQSDATNEGLGIHTATLNNAWHWLTFWVRGLDNPLTDLTLSADDVNYHNPVLLDTNGDWVRIGRNIPGDQCNGSTMMRIKQNGAGTRRYYIDGVQVEALFDGYTYHTPYCDGDRPGCSWTGTAHASTTSRTAGFLRIPAADCIRQKEGTVRIAIRSPYGSSGNHPLSPLYLWSNNKFTAAWVDGNYHFSDGTNTLVGTSGWVIGSLHMLHYTWSPATGIRIYLNGSLLASNATYTPPTIAEWVYIGTFDEGQLHGTSCILDFTTFDRALTPTQIANDYQLWRPQLEKCEQIGEIPYLWTKDGDNVLDNCDDSSRDNWCICGGIPGDAPARTHYRLTPSAGLAFWLGGYGSSQFYHPSKFYVELSGSANANCSGGAYESVSAQLIQTAITNPPSTKLNFFIRLKYTGGGLSARPGYGGAPGDVVPLAVSNVAFRIFYIGSVTYQRTRIISGLQKILRPFISFYYSGTPANVDIDYWHIIPGDVFKISMQSPPGGELYIEDGLAVDVASNDQLLVQSSGITPELAPGLYNTIWVIIEGTNKEHYITDTATLTIFITPRWRLL